jgi:hypothetical protein
MGCFKDTSAHALPLLFANKSVTPELCQAYIQSLASKATPTKLPYFYVENKMSCFGGSTFKFGTTKITSLTGTHACTAICSGSIGAKTTGTAKCGGSLQFNLYASTSSLPFKPAVTTKAT